MTRSNSHPSDWDYHAFRVLTFACKESEGSFMVLHLPGKATSYSFKDKTSTLLHDFAPCCTDIEGCTMFECHTAYPYIAKLRLVDSSCITWLFSLKVPLGFLEWFLQYWLYFDCALVFVF
ncbi:hypothetical protein REPUB_Repub08aG0008800 [Reevesia pubescens]